MSRVCRWSVYCVYGALAQLGERGLCKPEVRGSIPLCSTINSTPAFWQAFLLPLRSLAVANLVIRRERGGSRRPAMHPLQDNFRHRKASRYLFGDLRDKKRAASTEVAAVFVYLAGIEPREGTTAQ